MAARRIRALYPVQRKFTIFAIAIWEARALACQPIGLMPTMPSSVLIMPDWSAKTFEKIRATATGATT